MPVELDNKECADGMFKEWIVKNKLDIDVKRRDVFGSAADFWLEEIQH